MPRKELTMQFNAQFGRNVTTDQIRHKCKYKGWFTGRTGHFQQGVVNYRPPKGVSFNHAGQYSTGHQPYNTNAVGTEIKRQDGYWWRKVAQPNKWRQVTRLTWEAHNGKIPSGWRIVLVDGDKDKDNDISNLMCVPMGVLATLNRGQKLWNGKRFADLRDSELRKAAILQVQLQLAAAHGRDSR